MRAITIGLALAGLALAGCQTSVSEKEDPFAQDVIDEAKLTDLLLQSGDPATAVTYFETAVAREPDRVDFRRKLAKAYTRAKRLPEAARAYQELQAVGGATAEDRLDYAFVAVRLGRFEDARALSGGLPGTLETPRRFLLDALLADEAEDWDGADAAYAKAEQLATAPFEVLNNWGVSLMNRGELDRAETVLERAVSYNSTRFNAKNNLAIARGLRGEYRLPLVPMTAEERAIISHNLGQIALQRGEKRVAKGLFAQAVDLHPRYYEAAADQLAQLQGSVVQ
ncbi:MAG: tetratricopeptide repeat protein [Pseudomonadota bacterium]